MRPRRVFVAFTLLALSVPAFAGYRIAAWIPGWSSDALTSTQTHASLMSESNPTWYNFNADGTLAKKTAAEDPTWRAAMTGTALMPTIQNTTASGFDQTVALSVLSTASARESHAEAIRQLVFAQAYDGVDIDYERLPLSARANFTAFIQLLASKLHADGKKLSVTAYAKTSDSETWDGPGGEDFAAIGAVADWVKLMAYDYSWSTSTPGPITPLSWLDSCVAFAVSQMPASKVMVGLPWYGYDWPSSGAAAGLTFKTGVSTAQTNGAAIAYDANGEATYAYAGGHTVYFLDANGHNKQIDLVTQKYPGVAGFCYWYIGSEDPAVWTRIQTLISTTVATPPPSPTLPPANTVSGSTLIANGATWRYLDSGIDQGTIWRDAAFNDGAWKTGAAQLGYGDGDEKTVVSYGPSSGAKYPTTYFRYSFDLTDPSVYSSLNLRLLRDDGAVVYLNGIEIYRSNMPSGAIGYGTLAATTCADDGTTWFSSTVDPRLLVAGRNAIAVEIHQADPGSSDITFDFGLTAGGPPPASPSGLQATAASSSAINLSWIDNSTDETGFRVLRCAGAQATCDATPSLFSQVATVGANATAYQVSGLSAATTYAFRVRSYNANGDSLDATSAAATTSSKTGKKH